MPKSSRSSSRYRPWRSWWLPRNVACFYSWPPWRESSDSALKHAICSRLSCLELAWSCAGLPPRASMADSLRLASFFPSRSLQGQLFVCAQVPGSTQATALGVPLMAAFPAPSSDSYAPRYPRCAALGRQLRSALPLPRWVHPTDLQGLPP